MIVLENLHQQLLTLKANTANAVKKQFTPVPYNIDFELNIISKTNDEALEIVEQIVTNLPTIISDHY